MKTWNLKYVLQSYGNTTTEILQSTNTVLPVQVGAIHAARCDTGWRRKTGDNARCGNMATKRCCQMSSSDGGDDGRVGRRPRRLCWSVVKMWTRWEANSKQGRRRQ